MKNRIKKILQVIIKNRPVSVLTVFVDKVIVYEWILFGKFKIAKTTKTI
ncbi:hypothetical protein [Elizabethkingia anophelis]|nr:hypothetical protein [Elizabethkingia anophelis]